MKDWFDNLHKQYGRFINVRLVFLSLLGLLLILLSNFYSEPEKNTPVPPNAVQADGGILEGLAGRREEQEMENKLGTILSKVQGAGRVDISVSLSGSTVKKFEKNVVKEVKLTEERSTQGVIRTTNETKENLQILTNREKGEEQPVVITEEKPVVRGIIIVADGANDSLVKESLLRAAQAGLNVSANKITVLPRER